MSGMMEEHRVSTPRTETSWLMSPGFKSRTAFTSARLKGLVERTTSAGSTGVGPPEASSETRARASSSMSVIISDGYLTSWAYRVGSKARTSAASTLRTVSASSYIFFFFDEEKMDG
jgi:hypothetical protein